MNRGDTKSFCGICGSPRWGEYEELNICNVDYFLLIDFVFFVSQRRPLLRKNLVMIDIPMNLGDTMCICTIYGLLSQKENEPSQNSKMQHCSINFNSIFDSGKDTI